MAREALREGVAAPGPVPSRQDPPWATTPPPAPKASPVPSQPPAAVVPAAVAPASATPAAVRDLPAPPVEAATEGQPSATIADAEAWIALVAASGGLRGPARILAEHSTFVAYDDGVLRLSLPAEEEHLKSGALVKMMADALAPALGASPQIRFEGVAVQGASLRERNERARDERQSAAESAFLNDPEVQRLMSQHGAKVVADSIRPFDEP
jgi:DNA polymerase-3 subunit gamma/tau